MWTCDDFLAALVEEKDAALREEHARSCEECSRLEKGYAAYAAALRDPVRARGNSPHVRERVLAAARAATAERRGRAEKPGRSFRLVLVLAALLAVVFVGGVEVGRRTSSSAPRSDGDR